MCDFLNFSGWILTLISFLFGLYQYFQGQKYKRQVNIYKDNAGNIASNKQNKFVQQNKKKSKNYQAETINITEKNE